MYIKPILWIILLIATCVASRGPHHPRGQSVAKRHVHYKPTKGDDTKLTNDENLLHDEQHIREDLAEIINEKAIENMTNEELEFHYFNLHDSDKNSQLDGLELLQAMIHIIDENEWDQDYFIEKIDEVLFEDDTNNDGFLSYAEFVAAKRKNVQPKAINLLGPKI